MSFSLTGGLPLFPSLTPRVVDPLYKLDVAKNEDAELVRLEKEHENFVKSIKEKDCHLTPIGKDLFECFLSYHSNEIAIGNPFFCGIIYVSIQRVDYSSSSYSFEKTILIKWFIKW